MKRQLFLKWEINIYIEKFLNFVHAVHKTEKQIKAENAANVYIQYEYQHFIYYNIKWTGTTLKFQRGWQLRCYNNCVEKHSQ